MRLNIKKDTFEKSMVKLGINYKIKEYDGFINSINRKVKREIRESLLNDTFEKTCRKIFGKKYAYTSINILSNNISIKEVDNKYFLENINSGEYDIFLEDNTRNNYPEHIQKQAYTLQVLKQLDMDINLKNNLLSGYSRIINNIPTNKCLNGKMFYFSDEEKKEIDYEISEKIITLLIRSRIYFVYGLERTLNIHLLTNKYKSEDVFNYIKKLLFPESLNLSEKIPVLSGFQKKDNDIYNSYSYNIYRQLINKVRNILKMNEEDAIKYLVMKTSEEELNKIYSIKETKLINEIKEESKNIEKPNLEGLSYNIKINLDENNFTIKEIVEGIDNEIKERG